MAQKPTSQFAKYPDLKDATVLITGGGQGIGAAMVREFAAQEAQVFFCDVNRDAGKQLAAELKETAPSLVRFAAVDLRKESQIVRWIDRCGTAGGGIDVLINNAALDPRVSLSDLTAQVFDDLFAVNLRAFALTIREAARYMPDKPARPPRRNPSIINFSSITCHTGPEHMSAYVATKAGIQGLTRSLARELGPRGIRVNTLSPGWVMTERQLDQYVTPAIRKLIRRSQCVPTLIQPEEIARVATFLASETSSAITGQEILADRGWAYS